MMDKKYRLTQNITCAGCAAKLNSKALGKILKNKNFYRSQNVVAGMENNDDAGVWKLPSGLLMVQTTDFFPPIVDDPLDFGRIAAANALSDIYVMGAVPVTALNLCLFPAEMYPEEVFSLIIEGGADILKQAECDLIGGHTIVDKELKYGIAVTGLVEEKKLITNSGAKPGELLFLTKALGTGIITTAIKAGMCPDNAEKEAIESMTVLNKEAGEFMTEHGIKTATDITGFGLAGHALEICKASKTAMVFYAENIPLFSGVEELINTGMMPAGSFKNKDNYIKEVKLKKDWPFDIIFDAQTSGGVLMCVPGKSRDKARELFGEPVGEVVEQKDNKKLIELV